MSYRVGDLVEGWPGAPAFRVTPQLLKLAAEMGRRRPPKAKGAPSRRDRARSRQAKQKAKARRQIARASRRKNRT